VTDASETSVAGANVGVEHRTHRFTYRQIRARHDSLACQHVAVTAAGRHRGYTINELRLADEAHLFGPGGAVEGGAFDEDRALHVVPGLNIGEQFRQKISTVRKVPQVMMRIADRQFRFENFLFRAWRSDHVDLPRCVLFFQPLSKLVLSEAFHEHCRPSIKPASFDPAAARAAGANGRPCFAVTANDKLVATAARAAITFSVPSR